MSPKRPYCLFVYVLLLAYPVFGLAGLKEVVLCFGEDGHVAVERASISGHCQEPGAQGEGAPVWEGATDVAAEHCGPCVDVAFAAAKEPSTRPLSFEVLRAQSQLLSLATPALLPQKTPVAGGPASPPVPGLSATLTSLRCVILLI